MYPLFLPYCSTGAGKKSWSLKSLADGALFVVQRRENFQSLRETKRGHHLFSEPGGDEMFRLSRSRQDLQTQNTYAPLKPGSEDSQRAPEQIFSGSFTVIRVLRGEDSWRAVGAVCEKTHRFSAGSQRTETNDPSLVKRFQHDHGKTLFRFPFSDPIV